MHGGPAGSWKNTWGYRWNYHLLAAPGYVIVLTDYTGSTGYGEPFGQEIIGDPLKGPAQEINESADDAIRRYAFIDGTRQAAGGGSYGGHLANWMQASTTRYKCLISHAGMVNSESQYLTSDYLWGREIMNGGAPWVKQAAWNEQNPIRFAARFRTPVLITVGEKDYRVPLNNSIENFGLLQRLKIPSRLVIFPDENHWILKPENSRYWYKEVSDWLKKYLGGEASLQP
jgi:dipeptidyl aminopeptidase/acylaminoacyl peptidase